MTVYRADDATRRFMDDVSGNQSQERSIQDIKTPLSVAKAVLAPNPAVALARLVVKKGVGSLTKDVFEKQSAAAFKSIDVISVYKELNDKYHHEWWDWEPETIVQTLSHEFGLDVGEEGMAVVQALQVILKTNQAHEHWHVFEKVNHAFNSGAVDFSTVQPSEPDELLLTLKIMSLIRPQTEYDPEVINYIAACLKHAGMVWVPLDLCSLAEPVNHALNLMDNDNSLAHELSQVWPASPKKTDPVSLAIQLGRLEEIKHYMAAHIKG